jgi:signal peptidase I
MKKWCACGVIDEGAICSDCGASLSEAVAVDAFDETLARLGKVARFAIAYLKALPISLWSPRYLLAVPPKIAIDPIGFCLVSFTVLQVVFSVCYQGSPLASYDLPRIAQRMHSGVLTSLPSGAPFLYAVLVLGNTILIFLVLRAFRDKASFKAVLKAMSVVNGSPFFFLLLFQCLVPAAKDSADRHNPWALAEFAYVGWLLFLFWYATRALAAAIGRRRRFCLLILTVALVAQVSTLVLVRSTVVEARSIATGDGMLPVISPLAHVLINKMIYRHRRPKLGEIVLRSTACSGLEFIGRVVALAGDQLDVTTDGALLINGKAEPTWNDEFKSTPFRAPFSLRVPDHHVAVMFDNRQLSEGV